MWESVGISPPPHADKELIGSRNQADVTVNHNNKILQRFFWNDEIAQIGSGNFVNFWVTNCKISIKKNISGIFSLNVCQVLIYIKTSFKNLLDLWYTNPVSKFYLFFFFLLCSNLRRFSRCWYLLMW